MAIRWISSPLYWISMKYRSPEHLGEPGGDLHRLGQVRLARPLDQRPVELAGNAAAQADDALVMGLEQICLSMRGRK